jgi:hypothetical protein
VKTLSEHTLFDSVVKRVGWSIALEWDDAYCAMLPLFGQYSIFVTCHLPATSQLLMTVHFLLSAFVLAVAWRLSALLIVLT